MNTNTKAWYMSKTLWFNIAALVVTFWDQNSSFLPENVKKWGVPIVAGINFLLRSASTSAKLTK